MSTAALSLFALLVVIVASCIMPKLNPGLLALIAALIIGQQVADMSTKVVLSGFPSDLFLLLLVVCLVFGMAQANGTLELLTQKLVQLIHGRLLLLPILFFLASFLLSAIGPGNIAAVALLASVAMSMAANYRLSFLLMAIMICTGANAGAFSPVAPTGIVASGLMQAIGLTESNLSGVVFVSAALLQAITAAAAYVIFLIRRSRRKVSNLAATTQLQETKLIIATKIHYFTLFIIGAMILAVTVFEAPLVLAALIAAMVMVLVQLGDTEEVLKEMPWSTMLMVCGIAVLIGLMEKTGGLDLATTIIATITKSHFINAALAGITGIISAFSSSSGVVMPAFIPLIPGLAAKMGITELVNMVIAVSVGSHMVDVSPLSTLGALALAAIPIQAQRKRVFRGLLVWGMSMALVGAGIAYVFLDLA
jgi:Na+/H+ antiporter NhaD/arsenite permease-like protein